MRAQTHNPAALVYGSRVPQARDDGGEVFALTASASNPTLPSPFLLPRTALAAVIPETEAKRRLSGTH